jgi:Ca2+:H+ antiporter
MLSNMLFVLGFCFFLAGLIPFAKNKYLSFSNDDANLNGAMLAVVILGVIVPACATKASLIGVMAHSDILKISRGTAIILIITYVMFLVFGLYTNPDGLKIHGKKVINRKKAIGADYTDTVQARSGGDTVLIGDAVSEEAADDENDHEEEPTTLSLVALVLLLGTTVLIAISSEFLVDSLDPLSKQWDISERFIGIILLPLVGNAAEHVTAVSSSIRGKMDLGIQVALGSTLQIGMCFLSKRNIRRY